MNEPRLKHATPAFRTFCGDDALNELPQELARLGASRAVVVCNPSMRTSTSAFERIERALGDRLVGVFDAVREHSPVPAVEAARDLLGEREADAVVAVGGGSAVVTARAASILLAEQQDVRSLCTHRTPEGKLVSPRLSAPKIPQWVVPSTPSTAYAKAGSAVLDPETGERLALFDPKTRAQGVFLDPVVAVTAPMGVALAAALSAFSMSIEGLQSGVDDPLADALHAHALRMLVEWMPRLLIDQEAPETRLRLMLASLMSGQGGDYTGGGLAQSLAHAVGPRSNVANGVAEAVLLPGALRYNALVTGSRLERIAEYLHARPQQAGSAADKVVVTVEDLFRGLGLPTRLRDIGVPRDGLSSIAGQVLDDWFIVRVPRAVGRRDVEELLDSAW